MPARTRIAQVAGLDLHQVITEAMHSLLILAAVLIPVSYFAGEYQFELVAVFIFALLANFLIRNLTRYIWQFILASGLVLLACLGLPILPAFASSLWPRLIALVFLIFLAVRSFVLRLKQLEEKKMPSLIFQTMALLFLLALNLIARPLGLQQVSRAYYYLAIGYLLLALLRWHRLSLTASLDRFQSIPTQPAGRIRRFNNLLLVGISLIMLLLLLLLAPALQMDRFLPFLGSSLLALIRWLVSLKSSKAEDVPSTQPEPSRGPGQGMQDPQLPFAPGEPARWLQILQEIFYYIILALAALIALGLLGYVIYLLYKRFYETAQPESDKTESLLPALATETKDRLARARRKIFVNFGQTPAEKIRRHFFRLIEGQIKRGLQVRSTYSPGQIMAGLDLERFPELIEIRFLYESARYGPQAVNNADLEKMQSCCRRLRRQDLRRQS